MKPNRRMQFVSDSLVAQVVRGEKTASVMAVGHVDVKEDDYDDALVVGEVYDVYDSSLVKRATIRVTAMELCTWDSIPERLWRGEVNVSADEFRSGEVTCRRREPNSGCANSYPNPKLGHEFGGTNSRSLQFLTGVVRAGIFDVQLARHGKFFTAAPDVCQK